jgi:RNA polymerase sigma-70 factor (ECF subfamily)
MTAPRTTTAVAAADAGTARIVRAAQRGDAEACEQLARSYQKPAYLFALQLTGHRDDALEVAQEAMLKFFRTLRRFDANRPVRPWLLRIVRNLVRDRGRRMRIRRTVPLQRDPEAVVIDPPDPSPSPEQTAARHELQQLLWQAMAELPPHYREVVALRDYMDLSYREIATALKIPTGTVMSRLHRARTLLRDSVSRYMSREAGNG